MSEWPTRAYLRRRLEAHLTGLGYSCVRVKRTDSLVPEIVRVSPIRGRIAYGEVVAHADLRRRRCHRRLLIFSQRRTRHRSSILFFIAVAEADEPELAALLQHLEIRNGTRGGHVQVVPIAAAVIQRRTTPGARRG